jgi:DNA-binding PadR family transcriptional regulator
MERRHHGRKRIGIPRGLLYHLVLVLLRTGPKSGSELTEHIYEYTDWRPSPGSIYPLLSNLQEKDLIEPYDDGEAGIKRFKLTQKGFDELDSHPHHEEFRKRNRTIRKMYWRLMKGMPEDIYESFSGIMDSVEFTWSQIDDNQVKLFKGILDNAKVELMKLGNEKDE